MAGKRKGRGVIEGRAERRTRRLREEDRKTIRLLRKRVIQAQHQLEELLAKKEEEMKETEKGKEDEEKEELEDGYTLDNDPSGAQCSRLRKSNGRNHEKWQRYKEIFSLYYAEHGDLNIPRSYELQGVKIGKILSTIRLKGCFVKNNPQRKQWLLERGVILTYDSGLCLSDTTSAEKWRRYKEIFSLYYAEHGNLKIPQSYEQQGVKIGKILYKIRHQGCYVKDNPQRKQWLLERGVILTYDSGLYLSDTTSVEKWQRYKEMFSLYYAEHGDLNIPKRHEHHGVKIGQILHNIRHQGHFVRDNAPRKLWLLEKGVSFTYDSEKPSPEVKWQRYKEIFSLFYAENGNLEMPRSYEHQGVKIGKILSSIRHLGCFVRDNPQRKLWLLEKGVSFTYDSLNSASEETWQRYKEIFSLYFAENGDLNIPQAYEFQGVKIGSILSHIRSRGDYVRDDAPRKQWLLEKGVSFTYDSINSASEEKWRRYKEIFSLYFADNGDLNIPQAYELQGVKIGWVLSTIRHQGCFVNDNPQRKQWLLEKGVSFTYDSLNSSSEEKWQRYKEIFSFYYSENGHLKMPGSYEYQGVKIGEVLRSIRRKGNFVRDNAPRKLWLLEKGVSFTYDSLNSPSEEKWQRYKEIFSLYFAENGDLDIPQAYDFQGVKIGSVLSTIRLRGNFVKDYPQRKQWLLEKGVSFIYDS